MSNLDNIPDFGEIPVFPEVKLDQNDWKDGIVVRTPNWLGCCYGYSCHDAVEEKNT